MAAARKVWRDLYWETWKGILLDDAYAHPAKFAPGLIQEIYRYLKLELAIPKHSIILDPFAGVACGAVYAMIHGYTWIGHEIEKQFYLLGNQNIQHWRSVFGKAYRLGEAHIILTDSATGPYRYPQLKRVILSPNIIVSSPPFGAGETRDRTSFQEGEVASAMSRAYTQDRQGQSHGNLARLKEDPAVFDLIVSSPPYEDVIGRGSGPGTRYDFTYHQDPYARKVSNNPKYGDSKGQLGNAVLSDDFWGQAQAIVHNCFEALHPGGYAVWVCKDFVRNKERVPFSDNWEKLCHSAGFLTLERIEASLVSDNGTQLGLIDDADSKRNVKERKTFFRRLAESKGSPRIDHEDVIVMHKPGG